MASPTRRQRPVGETLDDARDRHHFAVQLADFAQQGAKVERRGVEIKLGTAVDQPPGVEQIVDQMDQPQHRGADFAAALVDFRRRDGVLGLHQTPGVTVDHGQGRAELVRGHRHEIALHEREALLLRQLLLEHGGLAGQHALAAHQLDCVVAEHDGRPRHLADLVLALGLGDIDVGVVAGEPAHAVGEMQKRRGNGAADMDDDGDDHHARDHHAEQDEPERLPIGDPQAVARHLRIDDGAIGEMAERVARRIIGRPRRRAVDRARLRPAVVA